MDPHLHCSDLGRPSWMKTNVFFILMVGLPFTGCHHKESQTAQTNVGPSPLSAPVDYLGSVVRAKQTAQKTVSTVGLQQTIYLFQAQEGRLPKDLNELVAPNYLSQLPTPPPDMKLEYNPANGQVKLVPK